jgi:hypothetical protein
MMDTRAFFPKDLATYPCVFFGLLEQLLEVLVAFLVLVTSLAPLCHSLAVEDQDVEESIEK